MCWASPLPQGNALHAVRALAADRVIAAGDRGTVLAWDGHAWSLEDSPTRERLLALAEVPSGDLFAVGEHGTILRRGGTTWAAMASGTEATLRAIVAVDAHDVLVVGDGLALHFDGTAWARETLAAEVGEGTSLVALARHEGTVYAVGSRTLDGGAPQRTILARDASGWHALSTVAADVGSLCSLPDGNLVLSGSSARHGDGRTWKERPFGADRPLDAIWCPRPDDAWAGGYQGRLAHWDGHAWHHEELETKLDVDAFDGTSASDVWAVGEHGLIAHRDASTWTVVSSGTTRAGSRGSRGWRATPCGRSVITSASATTERPGRPGGRPTRSSMRWADRTECSSRWEAKGAIRRYAGGVWTNEPSGTTSTLEGVWASGRRARHRGRRRVDAERRHDGVAADRGSTLGDGHLGRVGVGRLGGGPPRARALGRNAMGPRARHRVDAALRGVGRIGRGRVGRRRFRATSSTSMERDGRRSRRVRC